MKKYLDDINAVIDRGRYKDTWESLQQYDAPLTVYKRPANLFAADFVGNPAISLIEVKATQDADGSLDLSFFNGKKAKFIPNEPFTLEEEAADRAAFFKAEEDRLADLRSRPGYVEKGNKDKTFNYHIPTVNGTLDRKDEKDPAADEFVIGIRPEFFTINSEEDGVEAEVYSAMPSGMETTIKMDVDGFILTSVISGATSYDIGSRIKIGTKGDGILLFDKHDEKLVAAGRLVFEA